jgi:hypothetical protein
VVPQLQHLLFRDIELQDILMLSVGTGRNLIGNAQFFAPHFQDGSAPLGYVPWLLDIKDPLLLIDLLLQAPSMGIDFQCQQLLDDRFHRLNPPLEHVKIPDDQVTKAFLDNARDWLIATPWLSGN